MKNNEELSLLICLFEWIKKKPSKINIINLCTENNNFNSIIFIEWRIIGLIHAIQHTGYWFYILGLEECVNLQYYRQL